MTRTLRFLLLLLTSVAGGAAVIGVGSADAGAQRRAVAVAIAPAGAEAPPDTNDLFPEERDVSDCIGTLERPDCGSERRGDLQLYLTFAALALGMGVIGWRIARLVRKRDEELPTPTNTF